MKEEYLSPWCVLYEPPDPIAKPDPLNLRQPNSSKQAAKVAAKDTSMHEAECRNAQQKETKKQYKMIKTEKQDPKAIRNRIMTRQINSDKHEPEGAKKVTKPKQPVPSRQKSKIQPRVLEQDARVRYSMCPSVERENRKLIGRLQINQNKKPLFLLPQLSVYRSKSYLNAKKLIVSNLNYKKRYEKQNNHEDSRTSILKLYESKSSIKMAEMGLKKYNLFK